MSANCVNGGRTGIALDSYQRPFAAQVTGSLIR